MIWWSAKLSPDVLLLLECERLIGVVPTAARARALSRARASLAAGAARLPIASRAPSAAQWGVVGLACVATVVVGAAAYELGARARPIAAPVAASPLSDSAGSHCSAGAGPIGDRPAVPVSAGATPPGGVAVRGEMGLLRKARAAVAREDFAPAMQLLAEHARRFRTGRLAEEREALRVRALVGLGRRNDARRAAAEFEANFPRSPLLLTVRQMPDSAP